MIKVVHVRQTSRIADRRSSITVDGESRRLDMDRPEETVSRWPAHKGYAESRTVRTFLDDARQQLNTTTTFYQTGRSDG